MHAGGFGISGIPQGGAQRFLPLRQAAPGYATGAVTSPTGIRTGVVASSGVPARGVAPAAPSAAPTHASNHPASNVVPLRPAPEQPAPPIDAPVGHGAPAQYTQYMAPPAGFGMPTSTAAARERRRQVVIGLTALAFVTLLLALAVGGRLIALHVAVDAAMLGYVILLVRRRQIAAEQANRIEPIRPPVTEQAPAPVQVAPSYLLRSGT